MSKLFKLFKKLLINRLRRIIKQKLLITVHQFRFKQENATVERIQREAMKIRQDIEGRKYCAAVFVDIRQAFNKIWQTELLYKLITALPFPYFPILKTYRTYHYFLVNYLRQLTPR